MTTQATVFKSAAGRESVLALYDHLLAGWPVPYTAATVPTRHGDTFAISSGPAGAPPLVLLHGAGSNSAIWAGDVAAYAAHFRVYAVDLPGEPGRSAEVHLPWEGPAFAEWLADVLDELHIAQAALAGISQGAWAALKVATAYPQRVSALALLTPGGIVPDRLSFVLRVLPLSLLGDWGRNRILKLLFGRVPVPPDVAEITKTVMAHHQARVGVLPLFTDEELRRLTMPVLLLGGDADAMRDMGKIAARLEALLPALEVVVLPGAGHALMDTGQVVLPFLRETQRVRA